MHFISLFSKIPALIPHYSHITGSARTTHMHQIRLLPRQTAWQTASTAHPAYSASRNFDAFSFNQRIARSVQYIDFLQSLLLKYGPYTPTFHFVSLQYEHFIDYYQKKA